MNSFKTLGPPVHVTDDEFAVHPVLQIDLDNPSASAIVTYLVLDQDKKPLSVHPDLDDAVDAAEAYNQSTEPGLP